MATIRVTCSSCGAKFDVATDVSRWVVECPNCHTQLQGSSEPAVRPAVGQTASNHTQDQPTHRPAAVNKPLGAAQRAVMPSLAHLLWVGLLGLFIGGLWAGGCIALSRYSAEAYDQQVARAERAEKELAALKETQKERQPAATLTPQPVQRNPQPAKAVQPNAEVARTPLNGDVTITLEVTELPDGRVRLCGTTNLPTDTNLMLSVEERAQGGFHGQSKCSVAADGSFNSEAFGPRGGLEDGVYVADVVMPIARLQPPGVRKIIGPNGENLAGPLVEEGSVGITVSAKKEFTIDAKQAAQAQQQRVKDRIQQYREWQKKVVALHSRLETARDSSDPLKWVKFAKRFRTDFESDQAQLMKVESMSARFAIGDAITAVIRMFHATVFQEPQDYEEASADYTESLTQLEKFIRESESKEKLSSHAVDK